MPLASSEHSHAARSRAFRWFTRILAARFSQTTPATGTTVSDLNLAELQQFVHLLQEGGQASLS
jgi:hypothetical protein